MITKSNESKKKEFKGVSFDVLVVGKKSMITKMNYKKGDFVPFHSHPNEQNGYVISGKYQIKFETYDELIEGMSEPDARQLLGEAYIFLTKFGTIERLNRYEGVLTEVEMKSKELAGKTPN